MLFSDFIKDSLLGKNNIAWNYYHHANINTDNILHADTSAEFIRKYFENGEKELPLLLNPEYAAAFLKDYFLAARKERVLFFEFDRQYALPPERAIHTVSGFFLGLLIENCLNAENSLSIENPGYFPFSYFWFLTFLYHDYGYCVVERDDSPIAIPTRAPIPNNNYSQFGPKICFGEYAALRKVKAELGIALSPFSSYPGMLSSASSRKKVNLESGVLRELTQRSCTIEGHSKLQFNTGTKIYHHQYTSAVVTRYFNYCINERKPPDHGIIGGYLFYDRIIKNYLAAYLSALQESHYPVSLSDFYFHERHFSENQLPVFSYISDCILSHNIWKQSEETRELYEYYNLSAALGETYKILTIRDNPLLYILAIADTLEPIKAYEKINPQTVSESINIEYTPGSHELTFSSSNNAVDISELHRRAKGLEGWTSARCTEITGGTFALFL